MFAGIHFIAINFEQAQTRWGESISHITQPVKNVWGEATQKTSSLSNSVRQNTGDLLTQPWQNWRSDHPVMDWAIDHPLLALGGLVLLVLLFSGLLKAIARFTEQIWYALLQAPLRLVQWLLGQVLRLFGRSTAKPVGASNTNPEQERLHDLVAKLEAMRLEQDELLKEIKAILATKE